MSIWTSARRFRSRRWNADGTGEVKYRGANWQVSLMPGAAPLPGAYVIVEVVGSRLVVRKV